MYYNPKYSNTCKSSEGNFKREFDSENEAQDSASFLKERHGTTLEPYNCMDCGKWHLAPRSRMTSFNFSCSCKDQRGNPKRLYKTKADARKAQQISEEGRHVLLSIYPCEHANGYHLTSVK